MIFLFPIIKFKKRSLGVICLIKNNTINQPKLFWWFYLTIAGFRRVLGTWTH